MRTRNAFIALAVGLCLALGMLWPLALPVPSGAEGSDVEGLGGLTTQAAAAPAAIVYVNAGGADGPGCGTR